MIHLTQTSYFWIINIWLKREIKNWQNQCSVQSKIATASLATKKTVSDILQNGCVFWIRQLWFPPLYFFTLSEPVYSAPASLSFATTVGLLVMLVLLPINLSLMLPTSVMVLFVQVMSILVNLFVLVNLCV